MTGILFRNYYRHQNIILNKIFISIAGLLLMGFAAFSHSGELEPRLPTGVEQKLMHVPSDVIEKINRGVAQELLVELDVDEIIDKSIIDRTNLVKVYDSKKARALGGAPDIDRLEKERSQQEAEILRILHSKLKVYKNQLIVEVGLRPEEILDLMPKGSSILLKVDNFKVLQRLSQNNRVKIIHHNRSISLSANWPTSYSDISIINSNITYGSGGHKGAGTRVAIIDTGTYLAFLPGWDTSKSACLAYNGVLGNGFHEEYLAKFKRPESQNCRVWDAYNFTTTDTTDYCGSPYFTSGNPEPCYYSKWQHGTVVAQAAALTAPGTYLTLLQVFDKSGNGDSAAITRAFDYAIAHALESPRIAAVNLSVAEDETLKKTFACPESRYASRIQRLKDLGVVTVVATGNNGWRDGVVMPACVTGVISVAATTDSQTVAKSYGGISNCSDPALPANAAACFSNAAPSLTSVWAPGVDIGEANIADGSNLINFRSSGTSVAAPHVSGQVAILRAFDGFGYTKNVDQISYVVKNNGPWIVDRLATPSAERRRRIDVAASLAPQESMVVAPQTMLFVYKRSMGMGITTQIRDPFGALVNRQVLYSTSDPSVAIVSAAGVVSPVGLGAASIMVKSGTLTAVIPVIVVSQYQCPPYC